MKKSKPAKPRSKPASRKKTAPPSLSEMRGVACFETNEIILLVQAGVEEVAKAFKARRKLKTWLKRAYGKSITVSDQSYVVYQLKGHPYTIVDSYFRRGGKYPNEADAAALSKALKTKVIFYGNSDTASATDYALHDRGKLLESFKCYEGIEFSSKVRDVEVPEDGPDIYPFVDTFMRQQDAFAPGWSGYFGGFCHKPGDKIKLEFASDFEEAITRLDFLGA